MRTIIVSLITVFIFSSKFRTGLSITSEDEESWKTNEELTEFPSFENKTVTSCSTTEIQSKRYIIDYSWTIKGIYSYLLSPGSGSQPIRVAIEGLKFHENDLKGNWSIELTHNFDGEMQIKMIYDAPDNGTELRITGNLYCKPAEDNSDFFDFHSASNQMGPHHGAHTMPGSFHQGMFANLGNMFPHNMMPHILREFSRPPPQSPQSQQEIIWHDQRVVEQLVQRYFDERYQNNNGSAEEVKDELNFIFHVVVTKQLPMQSKTSTDCQLPDVPTMFKHEALKIFKQRQEDERMMESMNGTSDSDVEVTN